ncbi:L,D-transpeptidase family protein [Sphingomonas sp. M1-B02]|uniref:L,D-transpeptidase family protein n=1 Tax=Sphingomonas sp. M1-B02 TaxID=3114300 RepID=UPI00223FBA6D|nr:L,D-transpeptidase family protein [Sphingomonas sp. S6-11]UZK66782.1 L,D-transpeptidase family protein [Sphingomonas sp. S6-11]
MRKKVLGAAACLALISVTPLAAQPEAKASKAKPAIDYTVMHAQVILDSLGFSPGIVDGREGQSLTAALKGFQSARGLTTSGKLDKATLSALHPYRARRPVVRVALDAAMLRGPYVNPMPDKPEDQAMLASLGYARPLEKLAEMFHTTPELLVELNPGGGSIASGAAFLFPNVVPEAREYASDLKPEWRQTLADLNVNGTQPAGERIVVDKSEKVLKVFDKDDKLVAQFSASMGSQHDPLPLGTWKINVVDTNPKFHFNPDLFWDSKPGDEKTLLPAGPNGPVGVVWLDLSKEHYGIHGTPEPQNIGRTQSHGCIRLTNWDAARLALMVKAGTEALFQE